MPKQEESAQEQHMLLRMKRTGKLFAFPCRHRHELIDEAFEEELEAMYRQTGAGKAPVPPGLMAMATIPRGYLRASDALMVELTVFDLRVQMVLDCVGSTEPTFSQGALFGHGWPSTARMTTSGVRRRCTPFVTCRTATTCWWMCADRRTVGPPSSTATTKHGQTRPTASRSPVPSRRSWSR